MYDSEKKEYCDQEIILNYTDVLSGKPKKIENINKVELKASCVTVFSKDHLLPVFFPFSKISLDDKGKTINITVER